MGHRSHGGPRALPSHVLRYGFRTINGTTGGVNVEASVITAAVAIAMYIDQHILELEFQLQETIKSD